MAMQCKSYTKHFSKFNEEDIFSAVCGFSSLIDHLLGVSCQHSFKAGELCVLRINRGDTIGDVSGENPPSEE